MDAKNIERKIIYTFGNIYRRCNNPSNSRFNAYGGRGIKCQWNSTKEFRIDMLEPLIAALKKYPNQRLSIDRIDNDGDYCKENCQWIPLSENSSKDNLGKPKSEAHKIAMSKERKGKPQTAARKAVLDSVHEHQKKKIVMLSGGKEICCFTSIKDAGIFISADASNIQRVAAGGKYRKSVKGYGFRYLPST